MTYAGIDFDTHAVHVVLLGEQLTAYHRFELEGQDAFDRTRAVRDAMPSRGWWLDEGIVAAAIEEPAGKMVGFQFRVQGAVLACLPPTLLVEKFMPSQWRKAVGLPGNASKQDARWLTERALDALMGNCPVWPQDACDAYCLALAISTLVESVPTETAA